MSNERQKHNDQECSILGTLPRVHTECDERMQIANRCPCKELTYVQEQYVSWRRGGNDDTTFMR